MQAEQEILAKAHRWLEGNYDEETKKEVRRLMDEDPVELTDAFYKDLDFGTGGLRGIMGVGTNRINAYTLGMATQGLSNYLKKQFPDTAIKVAIAYDSRNNSAAFARKVAEVFAANDIYVYLFEDLRPTPLLSFAIRHLGCHSGVVLTASHNPKEYNGYKVYWDDGAQLVAPHDKKVIEEVRKICPEDIHFEADKSCIEMVGEAVDAAYLHALSRLTMSDAGKEDLSIVFTPLHGTSITLIPRALRQSGFEKLHIIEEQATPDGNFPTVDSPNPEEASALAMAVEKAEAIQADLIIGTDPDTDRIGIAIRDRHDKMLLLNGNQTAALLIDYILSQWQEKGQLSGTEFLAKTIVTTGLIDAIAAQYQVECFDVLTGFKYIAELIRNNEGKRTFIAGGEESYGYLIGDFVRDKDAVSAAVIIAEMAAFYKAQGSSLLDQLQDLYLKHGFYKEHLLSITKKGKQGSEAIREMMERFRKTPPREIAGEKVIRIHDYQTSEMHDLQAGTVQPIDLPRSNVLQFFTADGTKITARPSGTEPKIKFYVGVKGTLEKKADYEDVHEELSIKVNRVINSLNPE